MHQRSYFLIVAKNFSRRTVCSELIEKMVVYLKYLLFLWSAGLVRRAIFLYFVLLCNSTSIAFQLCLVVLSENPYRVFREAFIEIVNKLDSGFYDCYKLFYSLRSMYLEYAS